MPRSILNAFDVPTLKALPHIGRVSPVRPLVFVCALAELDVGARMPEFKLALKNSETFFHGGIPIASLPSFPHRVL